MSAINEAALGDLQSLPVSEKPGWSRLQREKKVGENWETARINNLRGFFSVKGQRNEGGMWGQGKCMCF